MAFDPEPDVESGIPTGLSSPRNPNGEGDSDFPKEMEEDGGRRLDEEGNEHLGK